MSQTEAAAADPSADQEQRRKAFNETWNEPSGFPGGLASVDNFLIGVRFLVTSFSFFLVAGALALLMRIQLVRAENTFLGPEVYNRLFTMHGTIMMYLFAVPFQEGLAALLLPWLLGSRDLAYPRLTAFSYWVFLFSGLIFFSGFLFDAVADIGWFAYTPLSAPAFANKGIDFWVVGLGAAEVAGIAAGAELTVSILRLRAPGMSLNRMPLYAWAWLATALMIVFAFTTLLIATLLLECDHDLGTHFFDDQQGGNHLLWQHLFWFFGHPDVYIIFLPATGVVSMIVCTFSRRIVGYTWIVVGILLMGFLSFGLWVHHMYTTGLPELSLYFFAGASLMIAIASGVQIFAWIASLWGRRPALQTPLLFVLGFVFIFVLGGLTGVMVAVVPFDLQVHDTYFLVAHFHYVLIGGAVFPILAGVY
jgi:cytochrome c oxidase subunit I+III